MDDYKTMSKALTLITIFYISLALIVSGSEVPQETLEDLDSMSRDLRSADKPDEAFQTLEQEVEINNRLEGNITGKDLSARIKLARRGLYDLSVTSRVLLDSMQANSSAEGKMEGLYIDSCPDSFNLQDTCVEKEYPYFTSYAAAWMSLGQEFRGLDNLRNDSKAWNFFGDYIERSEYYDTRLMDKEFALEPLQIVQYTDTGLYIVGRGERTLRIGNHSMLLEGDNPLSYANVSLGAGEHILRRGSQRIVLKIAPDLPDYGVNGEGDLVISNDSIYSAVNLTGTNGTVMRALGNRTVKIDVPSNFSKDSYRPYEATFISDKVNVSITLGEVRPGIDQEMMYFFGMDTDEYRIARQLIEREKISEDLRI